MGRPGYFITFEGVDGTGKSTQINAAKSVLEAHGYETLTLREPGGTALSEGIRDLVLDPSYGAVSPEAELLLMCAARAQLVREVIRPALESGKAVLCDRYMDSTLAYQGYGRGLDMEMVTQVLKVATGDTVPDRTVLLDGEPEAVLGRRTLEGDRIEAESLGFQARVREGFLAILEKEPQRICRFDASASVDLIARQIAEVIKEDIRK